VLAYQLGARGSTEVIAAPAVAHRPNAFALRGAATAYKQRLCRLDRLIENAAGEAASLLAKVEVLSECTAS
jgi:hypothetical protein